MQHLGEFEQGKRVAQLDQQLGIADEVSQLRFVDSAYSDIYDQFHQLSEEYENRVTILLYFVSQNAESSLCGFKDCSERFRVANSSIFFNFRRGFSGMRLKTDFATSFNSLVSPTPVPA